MKRMMEQTRCDRCGHEETIDAKQGKVTKKFGFRKNPVGWQEVNKYLLCPKCSIDYRQEYQRFFKGFIRNIKKK